MSKEKQENKNYRVFLNYVKTRVKLTTREFAKACGKQEGNMYVYLKDKGPGRGALLSCVEHLFEWGVTPLMEMEEIPEDWNEVPKKSGIYVLYDSAGNVLYIGKATNFQSQVKVSLDRVSIGIRFRPNMKKENKATIRPIADRLSLYEVNSGRVRHNLEALLLRVFINQTHNENIGKFK